MKNIELGNQDNFIVGSFEHKKYLEAKLEFELQKSEKISVYLDILERKISETQKIADTLLIEKHTENKE